MHLASLPGRAEQGVVFPARSAHPPLRTNLNSPLPGGGAEQPRLPGRKRKCANLNSASRWMGLSGVGVQQRCAEREWHRSDPGTPAPRLVRTRPGGTEGHGRPGRCARCRLLPAPDGAHRGCSTCPKRRAALQSLQTEGGGGSLGGCSAWLPVAARRNDSLKVPRGDLG